MKSQLCSLALFCLILTSGYTQSFEWAGPLFGTSGYNEPVAVDHDTDGNFYVFGEFRHHIDVDPSPAVQTLSTIGNFYRDAYLAKYSQSGNLIWSVKFSGIFDVWVNDIAITQDGYIYLTGRYIDSLDADPGPSVNMIYTPAVYNISPMGHFYIKLDTSGQFQWAQNTQTIFYNVLRTHHMDLDQNGNLFIFGDFTETRDLNPHPNQVDTFSTTLSNASYLSKIRADGTYDWSVEFDFPQTNSYPSCQFNDIFVDDDGFIYLAGRFSDTIDFDPDTGTFHMVAIANTDPFILKLDSSANLIWAKRFTGFQSDELIESIQVDDSGYVYLSGHFVGSCDFDPDSSSFILTGSNQFAQKLFITRLKPNGAFDWAITSGGNGTDRVFSSALHGGGNIYTLGMFDGITDFDPGNGQLTYNSGSGAEMFLASYNISNGGLDTAVRYFSHANYPYFRGVLSITEDGHINTAGTFGDSTDLNPYAGENLVYNFFLSTFINGLFECSPTYQIDEISTCDSTHTWSFNNMTYDSSGVYDVVFTNVEGCDSIHRLMLSFLEDSDTLAVETSCDSYYWSITDSTYESSGTYTATLTNSVGCDSNAFLDLTLNQSDSIVNNILACDSYVWPANGAELDSSGLYVDTLQNANGCDSIEHLYLTIFEADSTSFNVETCDSFQWQLNNSTYTFSGSYQEVVSNSNGCDSVVTLNLEINNSSEDESNVVACSSYFWEADSLTYSANGTYIDSAFSNSGCDSISILHLQIDTVVASISFDGTSLHAPGGYTSYKWIRCDQNNQVISGANDSTYLVSANGIYAAVVATDHCSDTSDCVDVEPSWMQSPHHDELRIYPNPTTDQVSIESVYENLLSIEFYNAVGELVYSENLGADVKEKQLNLAYPPGVYLIKVACSRKEYTMKLLIER